MEYTKDTAIIIGALARQGLTLKQITESLGITQATLNAWRKKYPELGRVLRQNCLIADAMVEGSLYQRAIGFEYDEEVYTELTDGEVKVKRHHKYMPSDITACIYWLKNRQPERWRERKEDGDAKDVTVIMDKTSEGYSE